MPPSAKNSKNGKGASATQLDYSLVRCVVPGSFKLFPHFSLKQFLAVLLWLGSSTPHWLKGAFLHVFSNVVVAHCQFLPKAHFGADDRLIVELSEN